MFRATRLLPCLLVLAGCERARHYDPAPPDSKPAARGKSVTDLPPLADNIAWMDPGQETLLHNDVRIEFVHADSQPEVWKKLPGYWNDTGLAKLVGLVGMPGLPGAAVAAEKGPQVVRIKVPLGLPDPTPHIPAANPPTRGKWELGRRLFFDRTWLTARGNQSCATCHQPDRGFSSEERIVEGGFNVPGLVNCVYNTRQFWDGRARYLEEVVQRQLEDEREPREPGPFRHVWHGVIGRLRDSKEYDQQFKQVFGTLATQDALGKALATYMRTLLAGNSIHDQARSRQQQKGDRALLAGHYEAVLDVAALKKLGRASQAKARVAAGLQRGWELFRGKARCAACHPPEGHFSDGRFHNIGVGKDEAGRFAVAPLGERSRHLKGAFRTPTLRGLSRTAPYFHDGHTDDLAAVVRFHAEPPPRDAPLNIYLDPLLAMPDGSHRHFALKQQDIADLVLFLQALDGDEVDRAVRAPGPR